MSRVQARAVTVAWHKPRCNACGDRIQNITEAHAVWFSDHGRTLSPLVVHQACDRTEKRDDRWAPVERFRRSPMDAVIVGMRAKADSEAERMVWHAWLSIVLGLPFSAWNVMPPNEVADYMPERVPSIEEARKEIGGAQ